MHRLRVVCGRNVLARKTNLHFPPPKKKKALASLTRACIQADARWPTVQSHPHFAMAWLHFPAALLQVDEHTGLSGHRAGFNLALVMATH